ncbi:MAG: V-type ATP synthase subunit D [Clostridia bacterium]|nr:V-type ATP synthase subunit D [Clostridia bacterium]
MSEKIVATKANLVAARRSLELAKTGYELMDKKKNILVREILKLSDEAGKLQQEISVRFSAAYFALSRAQMSGGLGAQAAEAIPVDDSLELLNRSVMGVRIPLITMEERPLYPAYGLSFTSADLDDAFVRFNEVKELTVRLAQTECTIIRLGAAIKKTGKRTNALSKLQIPKFENRIRLITRVLEEKEREEFSRLKAIKR